MKQICQRNNDDADSQGALMVLMISVKNAYKIGWFQLKESEELLTIAERKDCSYQGHAYLSFIHSFIHSFFHSIICFDWVCKVKKWTY